MSNHTIFEDKNIQFLDCVDLSTFIDNINLDTLEIKIKQKIKIRQLELIIKELETKNLELEAKNKHLQDFSQYTEIFNSLKVEKKYSQSLLNQNKNLEDKNKKLEDENKNLEAKKKELEDENKKLTRLIKHLQQLDSYEFVLQYRNYIMHLESTYIEDKDKDKYFKNLYNNEKKMLNSGCGYLFRCNNCYEINPIEYECECEYDSDNITWGEHVYAYKYSIEIKYNQKNCDYYINKIIGNLCYCCRSEFECNNTRLEEFIKENIEDINIKKINIEELINKTDYLYQFMWGKDEKTNDYKIYLYIDLNNVYDFSYIIEHLGWDFLINIKKKIIKGEYRELIELY